MAKLTNFDRMTGLSALAAGVSALGYAIAVVLISRGNASLGDMLSGWFLTLGGLFAVPVIVGLYQRLHSTDEGVAMMAFIFSILGAAGALMHGGYNLANAFGPVGQVSTAISKIPNQVDPRGLMTFAMAGLGWIIWSSLISAHKKYPIELSQIGHFLGGLLIVIYLTHLFGFGGDNPVVLIPSIMVGFFIYPIWYVWLASIFQGKDLEI